MTKEKRRKGRAARDSGFLAFCRKEGLEGGSVACTPGRSRDYDTVVKVSRSASCHKHSKDSIGSTQCLPGEHTRP